MVNKSKVLTIFFMIITSLIMIPNIVNAEIFDGYKIKIETNIERWSWNNDLIFKIQEEWKESENYKNLTKRVYLKGPINGEESIVEILDYRDGEGYTNSNNYYNASFKAYRSKEGEYDNDTLWKYYVDAKELYNVNDEDYNIAFNFDEGSTVKLIEEYSISENFTPRVGREIFTLTNSDSLLLDIDNNTVVNNSMSDYGYNRSTNNNVCTSDNTCILNIYTDCAYNDTTITSGGRRLSCTMSLSSTNKNVTTYNKGTIKLPTYNIFTNLSITGNAAPKGKFALLLDGSHLTLPSYMSNINDYNKRTVGQIINYENSILHRWNLLTRENDEDNLTSNLIAKDSGIYSENVITSNAYSLLSYSEAKEYFENVSVKYIPDGSTIDNPWNGYEDNNSYEAPNGQIGNSTGVSGESVSYTRVTNGNAFEDNRLFENYLSEINDNSNDYYVTLTYDETIDRDVPTGIFYNIIPYLLIVVISLFGLILFRRKKDYDENQTNIN